MIGRRTGFLLIAGLSFAMALGCAYPLIAAESTLENRRLFIAGSFIFGAVAVAIAVRCLRWRDPKELEAANDPNGIVNLALYGFETRILAMALLVMALGFGFAVFDGGPDIKLHVAGWLGMVGCLAASFMIFVTKRPASLRLSPEGLDSSAFGVGPIPWKDIRGARSTSALGRVPIVALDLNNEEEYLARRRGLRLPFLERLLLSSSFTVAPPAMEMSCDMLVKAIEIRIAAFGRGSQPA
jgi:hypothetical protein